MAILHWAIWSLLKGQLTKISIITVEIEIEICPLVQLLILRMVK